MNGMKKQWNEKTTWNSADGCSGATATRCDLVLRDVAEQHRRRLRARVRLQRAHVVSSRSGLSRRRSGLCRPDLSAASPPTRPSGHRDSGHPTAATRGDCGRMLPATLPDPADTETLVIRLQRLAVTVVVCYRPPRDGHPERPLISGTVCVPPLPGMTLTSPRG